MDVWKEKRECGVLEREGGQVKGRKHKDVLARKLAPPFGSPTSTQTNRIGLTLNRILLLTEMMKVIAMILILVIFFNSIPISWRC